LERDSLGCLKTLIVTAAKAGNYQALAQELVAEPSLNAICTDAKSGQELYVDKKL